MKKISTETDYEIQALVDHELSPQDALRVLQMIAQDVVLKRRYRQLCRQKALLKLWHDGLDDTPGGPAGRMTRPGMACVYAS